MAGNCAIGSFLRRKGGRSASWLSSLLLAPPVQSCRARCRPGEAAGAAGTPGSALCSTNSLAFCAAPPGKGPNPQGVGLSRPPACGGARDGWCVPQSLSAKKTFRKNTRNSFFGELCRTILHTINQFSIWGHVFF